MRAGAWYEGTDAASACVVPPYSIFLSASLELSPCSSLTPGAAVTLTVQGSTITLPAFGDWGRQARALVLLAGSPAARRLAARRSPARGRRPRGAALFRR